MAWRRSAVPSSPVGFDVGDRGRGEHVQVEALLESARQLGVARDPGGRTQLHLRVVGADQHVARRGDDDAAHRCVVRQLLDIRIARGPTAGLGAGDVVVRVQPAGFGVDQLPQLRPKALIRFSHFLDAQQRPNRRQVRDLFKLGRSWLSGRRCWCAASVESSASGSACSRYRSDVGGLARRWLTRRLGPPTPRFSEVDAPSVAESGMSIEIEGDASKLHR